MLSSSLTRNVWFTPLVALISALVLVVTSLLFAPSAAALDADPAETKSGAPGEVVEGTPRSVHTFEEDFADEPLSTRAAPVRVGDIKVKLVVAQLADTPKSEADAISLNAARNAVSASSNYWKAMSNNRLSMSVAGPVQAHKSTAKSTWNYWDIMDKVTDELDWTYKPYTALVIFVPRSLSHSALGAGWSSSGTSGRILMPKQNWSTNNVMAHEFGHVLGLMHADALQCKSGASDSELLSSGRFADDSCYIREYGDSTDLMGASTVNLPAISSSAWDYGKFGRGDEIRDLGVASGQKNYTLKPWGGTAANRAVKFTDPVSGEIYYVELRAPVGYDNFATAPGNRGVKIVQRGGKTIASSVVLMPSTKPFSGYYSGNHAWQAGMTFTTHAGTKVKINSVSNTSATITIDARGGTQAEDPFTDVSEDGTMYHEEILWAAQSGVSTGWKDLETGTYAFKPYEDVNRDAMAAFLYRLAGSPKFEAPNVSPFTDYDEEDYFYKEVTWLYSQGITTGWDDEDDGTREYRPFEDIKRDAMAAFLYRLAGSDFKAVEGTRSPFVDYNEDNMYYDEVTWLAKTGISTGWTNEDKTREFRAFEDIKRDAMAAFMYRYNNKF